MLIKFVFMAIVRLRWSLYIIDVSVDANDPRRLYIFDVLALGQS